MTAMRLPAIFFALSGFCRMGRSRRALAIEAARSLLWAKYQLRVSSFPKLAERLGGLVPPDKGRALMATASPPSPSDAVCAQDISWAVTRVAYWLPVELVCLPQAMAAQRMLRRRGIASLLHLGAAKAGSSYLDAHAWLEAAGVEVTGYPVIGYAEIGCFAFIMPVPSDARKPPGAGRR